MTPETIVVDNPGAARYELRVDGAVAGFITYRLRDDSITLLHADMNPELEGEGLGSRLVAGTLDDARARGLAVKPVCPFVVAFIESHPGYADLVR
ncbi:MAG: GNAT family N-acetyltransferase [Solirubrobacteraceae bacterium]